MPRGGTPRCSPRPIARWRSTTGTRGSWEWRSKALFQPGRRDEAVRALAQVNFVGHAAALERAVAEIAE